jgi:C4-dicarboxylate-specific signal transduction histidine kinase
LHALSYGQVQLAESSIYVAYRARPSGAFYLRRKALVETGLPQSFELQMRLGDATPFWAAVNARLAHHTDGAVMLHLAVHDVSAVKLADAELRATSLDLERRVRQRTADLDRSHVALRAEVARRKVSEEELRAIVDTAADAIVPKSRSKSSCVRRAVPCSAIRWASSRSW